MRRVILLWVLICTAQCASASMTIEITIFPQLTPLMDDIYLAGSINNWNPSDENMRFAKIGQTYSLNINGTDGEIIECKLTRGIDWTRVEGDAQGNYIPNRSFIYSENTIVQMGVEGWEDISGVHTVTSNVFILDSDMLMPQLQRSRRIWIKLPESYSESNQEYPVIYMHDGQNLFDQATSFAGEWSVDETIDQGNASCWSDVIAVGIDNGGEYRIDELSPWVNAEYNEGGQGEAYALFIVENLKPLIDSAFRTIEDRDHTVIMGSSLGGLISMYIWANHNEVFGRAAIFSPAFWFNEEIFDFVESNPVALNSEIYFVCGNSESTSMVPDMEQMKNIISTSGLPSEQIQYVVYQGGQHNESYWEIYFEQALPELVNCAVSITELTLGEEDLIYPNPASDSIRLKSNRGELIRFEILDSKGLIIQSSNIPVSGIVNLSALSPGQYTLRYFYTSIAKRNQMYSASVKLIKI
jgi:predicted alpha/beta superfamily hydrolase